jgi:hypothetical protein
MQEDIANLLYKCCIAAPTFEQNNKDVFKKHHLKNNGTHDRKLLVPDEPVVFSVFNSDLSPFLDCILHLRLY